MKKSSETAKSIKQNFVPLFESLQKTNDYLEYLKSSVLDKAFTGKLVN